ncbi:MAG: DUF2017 family protein [Arachnia sp.]
MTRPTWYFDGDEGRADVLAALVLRHVNALDDLVPETGDPLEQLTATLSDEGSRLVDADEELARLFPRALEDEGEAERFRRDVAIDQARQRIDAGRRVLADIALAEDDSRVPVKAESVDAWARTLSGLRATWYAALTQSPERLVEVNGLDVQRNPTAASICDWLGFLLEQLMSSARPGTAGQDQ